MKPRHLIFAIPMTISMIAHAQPSPKVTRDDILKLIGLFGPSKNPDLKAGLHAAKPQGQPGPLTIDPTAFAPGYQGQVVCQVFINSAGKVDHVDALFGHSALTSAAITYAKRCEFAPEADLSKVYPIYLHAYVQFKPAGAANPKEAGAHSVQATFSVAP